MCGYLGRISDTPETGATCNYELLDMSARISTRVLQKNTKCSSALSHPPTPVFLLRVTLLLCFQATSLYFTTIAQTSLLLWRPGKQMIKYSPKMCAPVRQGQCKQLQPLQPTHKKDKCNKHAWTTRDTDKHLRQPTLKAHRGIIHLVLLIDFSQDIREQCLRQNTPKPSLLGLSASVCSPLSDP